MKEYNGIGGDKIMATIINCKGESVEIKVMKGWQEIHIPRQEKGVARFYTKPTDYRSDFEYVVYSKDHEDKGDVFREAPGSEYIISEDIAEPGTDEFSSRQVWEKKEDGLHLIHEEITREELNLEKELRKIAETWPPLKEVLKVIDDRHSAIMQGIETLKKEYDSGEVAKNLGISTENVMEKIDARKPASSKPQMDLF